MRLVKQFLAILIALLVLVVGIQNLDPVELRFLSWSVSISLLILFPLVFLLGVGVGALLLTAAGRKRKKADREQARP